MNFQFLKNIVKDQSGLGIMQVMVAGSLAVGLVMVQLEIQKNANIEQQRVRSSQDIQSSFATLVTIFKDRSAVERSFGISAGANRIQVTHLTPSDSLPLDATERAKYGAQQVVDGNGRVVYSRDPTTELMGVSFGGGFYGVGGAGSWTYIEDIFIENYNETSQNPRSSGTADIVVVYRKYQNRIAQKDLATASFNRIVNRQLLQIELDDTITDYDETEAIPNYLKTLRTINVSCIGSDDLRCDSTTSNWITFTSAETPCSSQGGVFQLMKLGSVVAGTVQNVEGCCCSSVE